jgi:2-methylcitrate dehydratase PrpD
VTLSEKFVGSIARITFESLPGPIIEKTKLCLLHSLACTYAGRGSSWSAAARDLAKELSPDGPAAVWFTSQNSNFADAAFANSVAAQSILHEDIHRDSNAHPGIIIVPAALALGEARGLDGRRVLAAVAAGYEMMGRIGRGTVSADFGARGFRPTSIIGAFGAAMAGGLLLDLDLGGHVSAFALAANFTAGVNEWAISGTDDLYFQNGWATRGGLTAAALAKRGVTAPSTILEGTNGFIKAYGFSAGNLSAVNPDDGHYVMADVLFKPAPACALVQTTAQAALDAYEKGLRAEEIVSGEIITFALGKSYAGCDFAGPYEKLLQARMSNQFNFAACLISGRISNQNYLGFSDPRVGKLASSLKVTADPEYTKAFPVKQPVRVELMLRNGEKFTVYREEPEYLDQDTVVSKVFVHCVPEYGREKVQRIVEGILSFEKMANVRELTELIRS